MAEQKSVTQDEAIAEEENVDALANNETEIKQSVI